MSRTSTRTPRAHQAGDPAGASREGRRGAALTPPAYGLAAVDRGQNHVVQCRGTCGAAELDAGRLRLAPGGGRPLPESVRGDMEASFGADFSPVRIHVGSQADSIGADAFTIGPSIYFAPGRYRPDSVHGRELLGHELAHVVQQSTGRVRNPAGNSVALVHDTALEAEADRLGRNAAITNAVAGECVRPLGHQVFAANGVQAKNRDEEIIELMKVFKGKSVEIEKIRNNIDSVMKKAQNWALKYSKSEVSEEAGRDLFYYSKINYVLSKFKSVPVADVLIKWEPEKHSMGDNVALLMDFALAWKHKIEDGKSSLNKYAEQYSEEMKPHRVEKHHGDEKAVKEKSEKSKMFLTKDQQEADPKSGPPFPAGAALTVLRDRMGYTVNAGPSSSTATVLWFLRRIGGVTPEEAKSVVFGLTFAFWGQGLKHASGQYHTPFETAIPLARHLGKFVPPQPRL